MVEDLTRALRIRLRQVQKPSRAAGGGDGVDEQDLRCCNGAMGQQWDAGEMGCGQLVFELHRRLNQMEPGATLEVIARSPGAPTDLPAWCRMTGHQLLSAAPPVYVIRRKKR